MALRINTTHKQHNELTIYTPPAEKLAQHYLIHTYTVFGLAALH